MPLNGPAAHAARVVVTGGGSAGHVVPALPVIEALRGLGCSVDFIGRKSRLERELVEPLGVPYHGIRTGKFRRYLSFENLLDCFRIPVGIWQAWRTLGRLRPDVVFSKGGYVSLPVVVGAWLPGRRRRPRVGLDARAREPPERAVRQGGVRELRDDDLRQSAGRRHGYAVAASVDCR